MRLEKPTIQLEGPDLSLGRTHVLFPYLGRCTCFFKFGIKVVNRCSNRQRARLVVFCMIEPFINIPAYTFTSHCWARAFFRNDNWAEVTIRARSENELRSLCRLPHNIFLYHKAVVSPVCQPL